jgi:hypothetical protein
MSEVAPPPDTIVEFVFQVELDSSLEYFVELHV